MIHEFTVDQQDLVDAITEPKHVWYDLGRIVVFTGSDMPIVVNPSLAIDEERERRLNAGLLWNGVRWYTDASFRTELTSMVLSFSAGILPPNGTVNVRTMDKTVVKLGENELKILAGNVLGYVQSVYTWSWEEKDKL